ncbi:MAG: sigma factor [Candidatus Eisenbacteria bacterium]
MKRTNASFSEEGSGPPKSWEIGIATRLVKDAQLKWDCLRHDGEDDLVQDILEHWYRKKHRFDPKRGASLKTFMATVVHHKLGDIVDLRMAKKRKDEAYTVSLDEPVGDDDESRTLGEETTEDGAPEPLRVRISLTANSIMPTRRSDSPLWVGSKIGAGSVIEKLYNCVVPS